MKRIPEQFIVFIGSLVFFLLTLSENFSGPHDSINYLNGIVDGYPLANQHHLLYHYAAWAWLHCWQPVFPSVKDYYIIESFTAIWGSGSLAVVYSFFRKRFHFSQSAAALSILVIAFSYGFWFYSVNIEVYAPPLFFILIALYYITQSFLTTTDWWIIILSHVLAILFHQINILFAIVILIKIWEQRKNISFIRWLSAYALTGISLVGAAYFVVGWIIAGQNSFSKWIAWVKGYAGGNDYWQELSFKTPVNISFGYFHALLGGHYVFQLPPVKKIVNASLSNHSLGDEIFIARNLSTSTAFFLSVLTAILLICMLWLLIRFVKNFRSIKQAYQPILFPVLLTFAVYSLFFVFWMPEILEFWILQTVLMWLLLLGVMPMSIFKIGIKRQYVFLTLAGLLFCINYFGSIRWMQQKENDFYFEKASIIQQSAGPNDLVILQSAWIMEDFLKYFTQVKIQATPLKDSSRQKIDSFFTSTLHNKGKVFILPELSNAMGATDTRYLDSLRKQYATRIKQFRDKEPEMWVIE